MVVVSVCDVNGCIGEMNVEDDWRQRLLVDDWLPYEKNGFDGLFNIAHIMSIYEVNNAK